MGDILKHVTKSDGFTESRRTARLDIPIRVQYRMVDEGRGTRDEGRKTAVTRDISAGGCLLLVTEELPENARIELDILLGETEAEVLQLRGAIARLNRKEEGLYEYGISFVDMSKDARRLFADYCFAKMYEMIGLPEWPTDKRGKKE